MHSSSTPFFAVEDRLIALTFTIDQRMGGGSDRLEPHMREGRVTCVQTAVAWPQLACWPPDVHESCICRLNAPTDKFRSLLERRAHVQVSIEVRIKPSAPDRSYARPVPHGDTCYAHRLLHTMFLGFDIGAQPHHHDWTQRPSARAAPFLLDFQPYSS